ACYRATFPEPMQLAYWKSVHCLPNVSFLIGKVFRRCWLLSQKSLKRFSGGLHSWESSSLRQ
ncbi:hypothetical protein HPB47_023745, partial [Ixodes persulcatus]